MPRPPPRRLVQSIAAKRMDRLFHIAEETFTQDQDLAQRYVNLALKIGTRCRVRLTLEQRRSICHKCKAYLLPGVTARSRIHQVRKSHVSITCLSCGSIMRIPLASLKVKPYA